MSKIGKRLRAIPKKLPRMVSAAAADYVADAVRESYPAEHVRTGAARAAIVGKPAGARIRLKCGARKKASKSGKRRASRSGKINYAQFLPWLWEDVAAMDVAITKAMEAVDAL